MRFAHPLALTAAVVLPWIWWVAARKRPRVDRRYIAWRAATAVLALFAAAGLAVSTGDAPMTTVVGLDRSASISVRTHERALHRLNAMRSTMRSGDRLGLVSFGADAAVEWRPLDAAHQGAVRATVADSGTDIGAALRLAMAVLPEAGSRRILLMSDGRDTVGRAEREAVHAAADGVPVDIVPLSDVGPAPLRVTRLSAPLTAAVREPYIVSAEVSGTPGARGNVVVYRDDQVVGRFEVTAGSDGTAGVLLPQRHDVPGAYVYRAITESDEESSGAEANGTGTVVVIEGQPAILYVTVGAPALQPALTDAGYRVIRIAPEEAPATASALSSFAAVVLDDVPADGLTTAAIGALTDYVESSGGGLLVLGGVRSLTLGGYPTTSLESILPVDLRPRASQRAVPVEVVLLFDKSGSMSETVGGTSKIEVARQAVAEAVHLMPVSDAIGVLAFDSKAEAVAPLSRQRDEPTLRAALGKVRPGGATALAPAAETAFEWLRAPGRPAIARRHIIIISDGRTSEGDASRLLDLARRGVAEISAVAIGANANRTLLDEVARASGGRAYFPDSLQDLPRMVAREAVRSSAGGAVEERFAPHAFRHPVLAGIDTETLPPLDGYVVSAPKPAAAMILASHLDDPILCAWRAGLGRVAVFTADLASPWSARVRSWREGSRLWRQLVRWLSRRDTESAVRLRIADADGGPRLEMEADDPDGFSLHFDTVSATVRQPGGGSRDIALAPLAPGRYAAPLPFTGTGPYHVSLTAADEKAGLEYHLVRPMYWSADRETRMRGADIPFLSRLASLTGGRLLGEDESSFDAPRTSGYVDASTWLAAAALMMFVLDIASSGAVTVGRLSPWRRRRDAPEPRLSH